MVPMNLLKTPAIRRLDIIVTTKVPLKIGTMASETLIRAYARGFLVSCLGILAKTV
jgi:hypothetical protein